MDNIAPLSLKMYSTASSSTIFLVFFLKQVTGDGHTSSSSN